MIESLTRNWWIQLIRGALAVTLGATALVAPSTGMLLAVFLVAAFAIGDGAMTVTAGAALPSGAPGRSGHMAAGSGFIAIGLIVLFWQDIPAAALILLFAVWLIGSGTLVAYGTHALQAEIRTSRVMLTLGVLLAVAGLILGLVGPATINTFVTFAGWFGLAVGAGMSAVAVRLRADADRLPLRVAAAA